MIAAGLHTQDMTPQLRASYAVCRRLHRRHDPTYYFATRRLPAEVRPAVHALYAFVRTADELVDGPGRALDPDARRAALDHREEELWCTVAGGQSADPAISALVDAGRRHDLPLEELRAYMDSMRTDCGPVRIASWHQLMQYMNGSAAAVGRIMAPLLGAPGEASDSFASLGMAFQLTNFIRDVREDWTLDRMYLPDDERVRFGVSEEHIERGEATPGFRALVALEVQRARDLFDAGDLALAAVEPRLRPGMRMARAVYVGVLDRVERLGYDVLRARAGLPPWEAGRAVLGSLTGRGGAQPERRRPGASSAKRRTEGST
jgi:phytoene synthase